MVVACGRRTVFASMLALVATVSCARGDISPDRMSGLPRRMLWAWERPEDFRAQADGSTGIAYLAATIRLRPGGVQWIPRQQPLRVADATPLVAVVRIESDRAWTPQIRPADIGVVAARLTYAGTKPRVRALEVDFDATVSQRGFYRDVLIETRRQLPSHLPLTMTALASWCAESWLDDLPVDEAIPMLFRMGPDDRAFRSVGESGRWAARACRDAVGVSTDEPSVSPRGRRVYTFNPAGWSVP